MDRALEDGIMNFMSEKLEKHDIKRSSTEVKADVSEKEAMDIFNEIVDVCSRHNLSYQCACRIIIALNEAFLTGAVELYKRDINQP